MSHKYLIFNANSRISVIGRWDTICLTFYSSQASDVRIPIGVAQSSLSHRGIQSTKKGSCWLLHIPVLILCWANASSSSCSVSCSISYFQTSSSVPNVYCQKKEMIFQKNTHRSLRLVDHRPSLFLRFPHLGKYKLELEYFFSKLERDSKPWSAFKITTHTISLVAFCSSLSAFATLPLSLPEEDLPLLAFCSAFLSFLWVFRS